jgi:hypothetical protein
VRPIIASSEQKRTDAPMTHKVKRPRSSALCRRPVSWPTANQSASDSRSYDTGAHTDFVSVYKSSIWCPISRPQPDCLYPPNGIAESRTP